MIKKIILSLFACLIMTVGVVSPVFAVDVVKPACDNVSNGGTPGVCKDNTEGQNATNTLLFGPDGLGTKIVNVLSLIVAIAAIIVIMISAVRFIVSSGDPSNVAAARTAIIGAVVGLVVVALAQVTVQFVLSRL